MHVLVSFKSYKKFTISTGDMPKKMSATVTSSSLIVVSNRLPFVLHRQEDGKLYRKPSAGGLVTAVAPVMVQSGGRNM